MINECTRCFIILLYWVQTHLHLYRIMVQFWKLQILRRIRNTETNNSGFGENWKADICWRYMAWFVCTYVISCYECHLHHYLVCWNICILCRAEAHKSSRALAEIRNTKDVSVKQTSWNLSPIFLHFVPRQIYHFSFKNLQMGTSSFSMLVHHLPPAATPHCQHHHHNDDHHYHHIHPDHLGGTRLMLYLSSPSSFSARHSYFV